MRIATANNDWDTAIQLAARFPALGKHAAAIQRGWNAIVRPEFYRELGQDLGVIRNEAIAALQERFSRSWSEVRPKKPNK